MNKKIILIYILFLSFDAYADILFIDLNLSTKEVQTAERAAKERGEKLIVIPDVSKDDRLKIDSMRNIIANHNKNTKSEVNDDDLKLLISKYKINTENFESVLIQYEKNAEAKLSSIIISGHHAKNFFGENGSELPYEEIESTIKRHSDATKNIKSVYLWGCYTLTKQQVVYWKRVIPSAYMLGGWDGSAPREDKAVDHDALLNLLVNEKKYSFKTELKESLSLFNSIKGVKNSSPAICVGAKYISNHGNEDIADFLSGCSSDVIEQYRKKLEIVDKYRSANLSEYFDVPKNTGTSELRSIYSNGRQIQHCDSFIQDEVDRMIFLVFDKQVRKNISKLFNDDFKKIDSILNRVNLPNISDKLMSEKTRRSEAVNEVNRLGQIITNAENLKISQNEKKILSNLFTKLDNLIIHQNCMRPIWIEDVDKKTLKDNISCMFNESPASSFPFGNTNPSLDINGSASDHSADTELNFSVTH